MDRVTHLSIVFLDGLYTPLWLQALQFLLTRLQTAVHGVLSSVFPSSDVWSILSFSLSGGLHWVIPGSHRHHFELAPTGHASSQLLRHSRQSSRRSSIHPHTSTKHGVLNVSSPYCGSSSSSSEERSMQRVSQLTHTTGGNNTPSSSLPPTAATHS